MSELKKIVLALCKTIMFIFCFFLIGCEVNEQKVAYVDMQAVLKKSGLKMQEMEYINLIADVLKKTDEKAQPLYQELDMDERNYYHKLDQQMLQDYFTSAKQSARSLIINEAEKAIRKVAKNNGLTLKNYGAMILTDKNHEDVTDLVIDELKKAKVNFKPIPAFNVSKPKVTDKSNTPPRGFITKGSLC